MISEVSPVIFPAPLPRYAARANDAICSSSFKCFRLGQLCSFGILGRSEGVHGEPATVFVCPAQAPEVMGRRRHKHDIYSGVLRLAHSHF